MAIKSTPETLLTTTEAARTLGVSRQRVMELACNGTLTIIHSGSTCYFTRSTVLGYKRTRRAPGRPYSERIAFAALYMISGMDALWLSASEKSRLRRRLLSLDATGLLDHCRNRARTIDYWCRDSRIDTLTSLIRISSATGGLAKAFDLTETSRIEGYITADKLTDAVKLARLREGFHPHNIRLHVASFMPPGVGPMPLGVCTADLAESTDEREHAAGLRRTGLLLDRFKQRSRGQSNIR